MSEKIRTAVVTVSDTRTPANDASGEKLAALLEQLDAEVVERQIVSDDLLPLQETLRSLADGNGLDLIMTTGGTGLSPRDNTPEATRAVIEREAPGIAEAMRRETAAIHPMAMLSRGVCGVRGRTLIVNLPGSPRGVEECFSIIRPVLAHAIVLVRGRSAHS